MPRPGIRILPSNPCLDLYFHRPMGSGIHSNLEFHETLTKQLLPRAWSHDPLTTLKLICNLQAKWRDNGKPYEEAFYAAAFWLHHNHPKTLACNLLPIASAFGRIFDVLDILSRVLLQGQIRQIKVEKAKKKASALLKRRKTIATANKAVDRYHGDPDYWFLHDRVTDLMAECLKHDIQQFNQHLQQRREREQGQDQDANEKKMQTLEFNVTRESQSEFSNPMSLQRRLHKEVLVPLRQTLAPANQEGANKWGYDPCPAHKYMLALKKAIASESVSENMIEASAVLPHRIVRYAVEYNGRYERAAELQWKRMVEDVYKKQGRLNNCLAVCDAGASVSVALGLFVSELSQAPWEGKVVNYSQNPQLHLVRGEDLKSKFSFMHSLEECEDWEVDLGKVFDLILEVAVNENVKAEQMVRKVFVFTFFKQFHDGCWKPRCWETDYEAIQSKFKEKGYGNVVPHLVVWNMSQDKSTQAVPCTQPGVTMLSGFITNNLVKSFLDNDGDIFPDHVMEAAQSPRKYQSLVVVD
ncbi:hypothetical protein ACE6H2_013766 [Prunus campanulata]